ncbi:hypothetical protein ACT1UF_12590 [Clostridium septicum]|uniref:hypothetical protein n=1 Tax=Clostridium septicum TaxID=1504 RepID=UPI00082CC1F2|nr:hypothetical protein [Clostridium septicum]MDU1313729.1 hypothetical protein [Clostridium septicum]WLF68863.1 hypothetical protein Q6375_12875 [Clostridium septicum]
MNKEFIEKYGYILLSICTAIGTLIFSKANIIIQILSIVGQVFINKYILKIFIEKSTIKYRKMKLPNVESLSINPKIDYFISLYLDIFLYCFIMYFIMVINIDGFSSFNKLNLKSPLSILLIVTIIGLGIYGIMGAEVQVIKDKDKIIYLLETTSPGRYTSTLSSRVGKFKDGIIIDDYIFYNDEILNSFKSEKELIIYLKNSRQIIIYDKRAINYLKEIS